ncbi:hypothetical protein SAMN05216208_2931, partial [Roseovarius nanhaiticus]
MTRFALIALIAATATAGPALAVGFTSSANEAVAARDIADRQHGFQISELSADERGGLNTTPNARDIADREDGFQISELSAEERGGF